MAEIDSGSGSGSLLLCGRMEDSFRARASIDLKIKISNILATPAP
jgi:hypothetical protein